jgi:AraC-like DNA-binding protein
VQSIYGFHYLDEEERSLYKLVSIGYGSIQDEEYRWDGLKRERGGVIFQYTMSGEGKLRIGDVSYSVPKGRAFLVTVPSDHTYFYEQAKHPWEFLWIRIQGMQVERVAMECIKSKGSILEVNVDSPVIKVLQQLYEDTVNKTIGDRFDVSFRLYEWLLHLQRVYSGSNRNGDNPIPEEYKEGTRFIQQHLDKDISLDELAGVIGISKHHLCKMFPRYFGCTPMDYVRNRRLEKAAQLLRQSGLSITDISELCGYSNSSYFGKVFMKVIGLTPTEFRESASDNVQDLLHVVE